MLSTLCAVFLVAGYGYVLIPALFLVSVCLCLPVLIGIIMCVTNEDSSPKEDSCPLPRSTPYKSQEQATCAICACDFESGQSVIPLHCDSRHLFHTQCIQRWLHINSNCPICRAHVSLS